MLDDIDGNITDTYTYDAFGNIISQTGETENNYLYCGEQYDGTTHSGTSIYSIRQETGQKQKNTQVKSQIENRISDVVGKHSRDA